MWVAFYHVIIIWAHDRLINHVIDLNSYLLSCIHIISFNLHPFSEASYAYSSLWVMCQSTLHLFLISFRIMASKGFWTSAPSLHFDKNNFRNEDFTKAFHECHSHHHMPPKRPIDFLALSNTCMPRGFESKG